MVAVVADAVQIFLAPLFGEGVASPLNDALDLVVAGVLIKLLGFHWVFVPTFAAEAVPGLDLAPTWTAAVLLVTAAQGKRRWWWVAAAVLALAIAAWAILRLHHG